MGLGYLGHQLRAVEEGAQGCCLIAVLRTPCRCRALWQGCRGPRQLRGKEAQGIFYLDSKLTF